MKLKTLKDLERKGYTEQGQKAREIVLVNKLKAEAVKWVKFLIEHLKKPNNNEGWAYYGGGIRYLKKFFNITEDDLKQKENLEDE